MEVKPGYKQTEVGGIPEDWDAVSLGKVTSNIGDGIHTTPVYSSTGNYYFINGNNLCDGQIVVSGETKTVDYSEFNKHRKHLNDRSILISINGTIGNLGLYANEPIVLGKSAAYINVSDSVSKLFVYHSIQTEPVKRQFSDGLTGTTIRNLGLGIIRKTLIPLPPTKAEQEAIAEALSDADALIESLEQLLTKKRQLKQGAMQELLTGKKRLPGFSGEWEVKRLGEVATLYQPVTISAKQLVESGFPVYGANGIVGYFGETNHDTWQVTVTCRGSTCGTVNRTVNRCWITGNAMVLNCDHNELINKEFFFHLLGNQDLSVCITGTGQPQIVRAPLAAFEVSLPATVVEQTAIAAILSDMDADIAALEARLAKVRQLKQGMMQELLTGRIRLV